MDEWLDIHISDVKWNHHTMLCFETTVWGSVSLKDMKSASHPSLFMTPWLLTCTFAAVHIADQLNQHCTVVWKHKNIHQATSHPAMNHSENIYSLWFLGKRKTKKGTCRQYNSTMWFNGKSTNFLGNPRVVQVQVGLQHLTYSLHVCSNAFCTTEPVSLRAVTNPPVPLWIITPPGQQNDRRRS